MRLNYITFATEKKIFVYLLNIWIFGFVIIYTTGAHCTYIRHVTKEKQANLLKTKSYLLAVKVCNRAITTFKESKRQFSTCLTVNSVHWTLNTECSYRQCDQCDMVSKITSVMDLVVVSFFFVCVNICKLRCLVVRFNHTLRTATNSLLINAKMN